MLLEGTPLVMNTLNFEYGAQQDDHIDTVYMPPKKENCMLATWIALETITANAGPLRYYALEATKFRPICFHTAKLMQSTQNCLDFTAIFNPNCGSETLRRKP